MSKPQAVRLPRRIVGLTGPGSRGLRSPSPAMLRSPSPAVTVLKPVRKTPPACPSCRGTSFVEDDGQTICENCGTIMADNGNFANDITFQETDTGRTQQQGTLVRLNQTHQITFPSGSQNFRSLPRESMATGEKALSEARQIFNNYEILLGIRHQEKDSAALIFSMAYANGFVRGRTIESVAVVCLYLATRRAKDKVPPYSLMMLDFAEIANINVFDLGRMMQDMVKRLYIRDGEISENDHILLRAPGAEVLIEKFVKHLDFGTDEMKIKKDAAKILHRMKKDWLHDGRRPAGVCGAAVILAARMNNYRRTLREVVLCAKVTEFTVKQRLDEFKETDSSKLSVSEFRDDEVRDGVKESEPPAYLRGMQPSGQKKKRGRPRKGAQPETAIELEDDLVEAAHSEDEPDGPPAKRARIDADGFAVPAVPTRNGQQHVEVAPARRGRGKPKGSKNWQAPPPTEEEIAYENEVEHEIQEALDSNQDLSEAQVQGTQKEGVESGSMPTPADVAVYQHEAQPRDDLPGPPVWSNAGNTGNINMHQDIAEDEFDDDPEVSTCILNEAERALKEKIWVTENAEWLRQDHAKRIRRELRDRHLREQGIDPDDLARQKGKVLKRKDGARRSGRIGDVDYLKDDFHKRKTSVGEATAGENEDAEAARSPAGVAEDAMTSVRKMFNQRGTFSRRINYQSLLSAYAMPSESPSRSPTGSPARDEREDSVVSVASSAAPATRQNQGGVGEWFRGTKNSQNRSRASMSQEQRQKREREKRERQKQEQLGRASRARSNSLSPVDDQDSAEPELETATEAVTEHARRSRNKDNDAKAQHATNTLASPPLTQQSRGRPEQQTGRSIIPQIRTGTAKSTETAGEAEPELEQVPDTEDLPPSSKNAAQNIDSSALSPSTQTVALPASTTRGGLPSPVSQAYRQDKGHEQPNSQLETEGIEEEDVSDDSDDYVDPDDDNNVHNGQEDDEDEEGEDEDETNADEIDAAFQGRYKAMQNYEWEDEVVEDD